MVRKLKDEVAGEVSEVGQEVVKKVKKYLPYIGQEDLPKCVKDKNGKVVKGGEFRYFLQGTMSGKLKLIGVYDNGKGVARRVLRILTPNRQNKKNDKIFVEMLRKNGIEVR